MNTFFISAGAGPNALYSTGASGSASTPFWWHSRLYNPEGGGQPGPGGTGGPHMSSLNPDGTSNYQRARMPYITGETFQQHLQKKIPMQDGPEQERVDFCDQNQLIWILCFQIHPIQTIRTSTGGCRYPQGPVSESSPPNHCF